MARDRGARGDLLDVAPRLATARRALDGGEDELALAQLVEAWRGSRDDRIAALVEAASSRLALDPIDDTARDFHARWMAIAARRSPVDLPRLLAASRGPTTRRFGTAIVDELLARGAALATWPADPRTAGAVAELLRRPGYESSSSSTQPFWRGLLALVVAHADPRAAAILGEVDVRRGLASYTDRRRARDWFAAELASTLAVLRARATVAPPLATAEVRHCTALGPRLRGRASPAVVARLRARDLEAPAGVPRGTRSMARATRSDGRAAASPRTDGAPVAALAAAERALAAGDPPGALVALLDAWRLTRAPALAALVEQLGDRLAAARPLIDGPSRKAIDAAWREIARARDPVDLPRLLATVSHTHWRATEALARVRALGDWPDDPRTGAAVVRQLLQPPFSTSSTRPFWTALIALAVAHGDPRTIALLDPLVGTFERILVSPYTDLRATIAWFERQVAAARAALAARFPQPPALDGPAAAACARVAAQLATLTAPGDALLAEVHAHPDDDRPRLVYADALQERGDPRGELIALQLSGADPARVDALLAEHEKAWRGPLEGAAYRTRFERGFITEVGLYHQLSPARIGALVGLPIWSTVRRLELGGEQLPVDLLRHPVMRAVEHVGGLSATATRELLRWARVPYRSLGIELGDDDAPAAGLRHPLLAARGALAALRALFVHVGARPPRALAWLWTSWLGAQLEQLGVATDLQAMASWRAALARGAPHLRRLEVRGGQGAIVFEGTRARASLDNVYFYGALLDGLEALPARALTHLEIDAPTPRVVDRPRLARLRRRIPSLELARR